MSKLSSNPATGVPCTLDILSFHKIGGPPGGWKTWFYIPQATFVAQLNCLQEGGWQVIDLDAFLRGLVQSDSLPERAALLTFDDGYRSMRTVTLPLLLEFGYPAVLFVPTDFIGKTNAFDAGNEPEELLCGWDDLRELERHGVSIQSHAASHRPFSEFDPAALEEELRKSKTALEDGLDKPVEVLAYPYGDGGTNPGVTTKLLARTGYRAACLYKGGPNSLPIADPYRLTRIAMGPDTDLQKHLRSVERR